LVVIKIYIDTHCFTLDFTNLTLIKAFSVNLLTSIQFKQ